MKFDKYKAFPYPVLRPFSDDYLDVEFQAAVEFTIREDKIKVELGYAISSEEILNEIERGHAKFISTVSCRDTYFQEKISSVADSAEFELSIGKLKGEVFVNTYVVVTKNINSFVSPDINSEFGSESFKFRVGDVLAQDETQVFYIDRDFFKPISSVFELVKRDGLSDGVWEVNFDQDHVQIEVNAKMKESIENARNSQDNQAILINSIYFASVMQAVQKLKDPEDKNTYENYKWAKAILGQAHNKGIDLEGKDAYLITEHLMQLPLNLLNNYVFKGND